MCALDDTCEKSFDGQGHKCNCDARLPAWKNDKIKIMAKQYLPITAFQYGPQRVNGINSPKVKIGKLTCKGK